MLKSASTPVFDPARPDHDAEPVRSLHWAVRMNHINRSWSWAVLGGLVALHFWSMPPAPWVWAALAAQFLLYPQLACVHARRARDPLAAEIRNMQFDALALGIWSAALGFPLWIAFLFGIGPCINLVAFQGGRGVLKALLVHLLGMALVWLVAGWRFEPQTSLTVSVLSIVCLSAYLVVYGLSAHARAVKLHQVRERLHRNEQALQSQLDEIQLLQNQLKDQVDRDPLTGLFNRRHLAATMDRELARCARDDAPISAIMIDIDHFKQINDTHGHPAGDQVLKAVAELLARSLRAGDIACRYGGEEFLLLLPGTALDTAKARAQSMVQRVAELRLPLQDQALEVQVSAGVAEAPLHATDAATLIQRADAALYRAKAEGRNRVNAGH